MFDDIIIGAGSAGAVMAARLSADPARQVLLIEAGNDYPSVDMTPPELLDPNVPVFDGHNWHIDAETHDRKITKSFMSAGSTFLQARFQDQKRMVSTMLAAKSLKSLSNFDYSVGKVVGGSSAVNGTIAMRGIPEDYDEWAALTGSLEWSWEAVLPTFVALENDTQKQAPYHGQFGPVPIMRETETTLTPLQKAFLEVCVAKGYAQAGDFNAPDSTGVGFPPKSVQQNQRMSTALTHLAPVRHRPNLQILPNTLVDRLRWKNARTCDGVEVIEAGERRFIQSRRVILCAGTLNSPGVLMRSGVGDPTELNKLGIATHHVLPGIGQNLSDHPTIVLWATPEHQVYRIGEPIHQVSLIRTCTNSRFRNDMHIGMVGGFQTSLLPFLTKALGSPIAAGVTVSLSKPVSSGRLRLASSDPAVMPSVMIPCLQQAEDMRRMKEGVRMAWDIIQDDHIKSKLHQIFGWTANIIASDNLLEKAIATFVQPSWHVTGTVKMGRSNDPLAVVDAGGKLFGADNLWVADASIMPTIPSAPTHLSCVMIAERIAPLIR